MKAIKEQFVEYLEKEDKEAAYQFVMEKLQLEELDIIDLYTKVLTPALNEMKCELSDHRLCIWKEHIRTAIVRTIVEACYPYVLKKKKELGLEKRGNVIVVCPPEEFHDLGARMVSDFFTINGFHTVFVGSNTPFEDFYQAVEILKPDVVAISVSNYYNLVVTKKIITAIREKIKNPVQIIVGGNAFLDKPDQYKVIGADSYAATYEDIQSLCVGKGAVQ